MPTIPEALAIALQHHQAGRLHEAEPIYRQILAADPNHPDAWHLLGVIAYQVGNHEAGVECIQRALAYRPHWAEAHYNLGNAWRGQGKLDEAVACYQRALQLKPDYAAAHNNLGNVFKDQGKLDEAMASYQRALKLRPDFFEVHYNLGKLFKDQGKLDQAMACYRRVLELKPEYSLAHNNLGNVFKEQGKLHEAVACYRRALKMKPDDAVGQNNLGIALAEQGKLDEGVACFQRALQLKPDYAEAHNNLGIVFKDQGKLDEAMASYQRALRLKPDYAEAHNNLGNVFKDQGKLDETMACFQRALQLKSDFAEAHINLGTVFKDQGKLDEAMACFQRALQLKPDFAEAHINLGNVFKDQGKLDEAMACYQRALQLKPDFAKAHNNLGSAFKDQGKLDEAMACYQRAFQLKPDYAEARSNYLLANQYRSGVTLSELAVLHAEYHRVHAAPLRTARPFHQIDRDPHRRLRVGFVSPDFGRHPVGYFLIRALENLDRGQIETVCYSDRYFKDDLTRRFQAAATKWWDVSGLSNERLTQQILEDRIDLLFDLAGHTGSNRLLVFASKPAPVQITWIGYEGTTGLHSIDYILADSYTIPAGEEVWYREQVLRMPDGYVCYDPPRIAPEVGPLPAAKNGYLRFGSFNNLAKITSQVVEIWAQVLHGVPNSRLVLKYRGLDDVSVCQRYLGLFMAFGIDTSRVELTPRSPYVEYLAAYGDVDIALDPFPFGGGITTCEALWMGVPVITCPRETFASRHSLSHLSSVGLTETIARTLEEYVELAVSLAGDLPRLASLRAGLRQRMAASPLCDGQRFAANLMHVLRDAWQEWCHKEPVRESQRDS
jgi:predicted O-linked N-acetylglucosamine transferase (SPINDLY family)